MTTALTILPADTATYPRGLTRPELILRRDDFGAAVVVGMTQATRADRAAVKAARDLQAELRGRVGYAAKPARILTDGAAQNKLSKNKLPSFGMMLTPERGLMRETLRAAREVFNLTGAFNVCPLASLGCAAACLVFSGQSGMPTAQRAQAIRTMFLLAHPYAAGLIIGAEIRAALRRHGRINLRMNTTSDIRWELVAPDMIAALAAAGVQLYDYTAWRPADRAPSADYHLTYSAKESAHTSDDYLTAILASGNNVAVPFDTPRGVALPATWHGYPVIDGDLSDERRNDPRGVVVGLRAKGHLWKRPGGNAAGFIRSASASV
jgi:hypothetical protein